MPRILFIQPTQYGADGTTLCKQKTIHLPGLAFAHLAAFLPDHWQAELVIEVVDDIDYDHEVDLVAIGAMGHAIFRGFEIADEFRRRGRTVVMGGYMVSIAAEVAAEHADALVIGDAEISFPRLLADFEDGRLQPVYEDEIESLAGLPVPRYELLTGKPIGNMLPVQAGRGCPHSCSFCSIACLYRGRYLPRPLEDIVRDIEAVRALGFRRFYLIDDNLVANPGFLEDLCDAITPLKMKWATQCSVNLAKHPRLLRKVVASGGELLSFGLESISQEGLDKLDKAWLQVEDHELHLGTLSRAGIVVSTEMIVGTDGDTEESIRETLEFVDRNRIPIPRFYILTPIPGTDLYHQMKEQGRLITEDWKLFDGTRCVHRPEKIDPDRLTEMYWWLNEEVFSWRSIFRRVIGNRHLWRNPRMLAFSLVVNLHYRRYVRKRVPPNIF
jgi:radical SAM superfamily enzyme YgiQ (UPF0313 family)